MDPEKAWCKIDMVRVELGSCSHSLLSSTSMASIQTFIKVALVRPQPHCIFIMITGHARHRCRPWDSRFVRNNPPISQCQQRDTGLGLLYYGQNYLIYPSAFPPGSRTGTFHVHRACRAFSPCSRSPPGCVPGDYRGFDTYGPWPTV